MLSIRYIKKFGPSYEIKMSFDGNYLAQLSGKVTVYRTDTWEKIAIFSQLKHPDHLEFSHNSKLLAVKNTSGRISVYDLTTLAQIKTCSPTKKEGGNLLFSPDDRFVISAEGDGSVAVVNMDTDSISFITKNNYHIYFIENNLGNDIFFLQAFDLVERCELVINWRFPFDQYQPEDLKLEILKAEYGGFIHSRYNYINNCYIIFYKERNELSIFDEELKKQKKVVKLTGSCIYFTSMNISPDGKYVVLSFSYATYIFRFSDLQCIKQYNLEYNSYADFSKDGRYLLLGTWKSGYCIDMNDVIDDKHAVIKGYEQINDTELLNKKGLTKETLSAIPEECLSETLATYALEGGANISCRDKEELSGLLIFYLTWWFEQEIGEGGVKQYFQNALSDEIRLLRRALDLLKAREIAKFVSKAVKLYEKEMARPISTDGDNAVTAGKEFVYTDEWEKLEHEYDALDESLDDLRLQYLHENMGEFIEE